MDGWLINGEKMWITGMHVATHCAMFCPHEWQGMGMRAGSLASSFPIRPRASRLKSGCGHSTCPPTTLGCQRQQMFGCPDSAMLGRPKDAGSRWRRVSFTRTVSGRRRPRCGAAQFCVDESVKLRSEAQTFRARSYRSNQAIQFPLVELATQCRDAASPDLQDRMGDGQHAA